jgi:hypothetical protein
MRMEVASRGSRRLVVGAHGGMGVTESRRQVQRTGRKKQIRSMRMEKRKMNRKKIKKKNKDIMGI